MIPSCAGPGARLFRGVAHLAPATMRAAAAPSPPLSALLRASHSRVTARTTHGALHSTARSPLRHGFTPPHATARAARRSVTTASKARGVEATGSVARDHLANERTFLAWARSGLGFVALGVAVDQVARQNGRSLVLGLPSPSAMPERIVDADDAGGGGAELTSVQRVLASPHLPGILIVGTGGAFLSYATHRYFTVMRSLLQGRFIVNKGGVAAVVAATSIVTAGALGLVLLPRR